MDSITNNHRYNRLFFFLSVIPPLLGPEKTCDEEGSCGKELLETSFLPSVRARLVTN